MFEQKRRLVDLLILLPDAQKDDGPLEVMPLEREPVLLKSMIPGGDKFIEL